MKLVTVAEIQSVEREANERGWTYAQMMEKAGNGLAEIVLSFYGYEESQSAVGLVGTGNNGGDTLIALERLAKEGWQARAYLIRPRKDDALVKRLKDAGGEVDIAGNDPDFATLDAWLREASVLLDGVLGTGFHLPLKAEIAKILRHVKELPALPDIVAVDCPSGVDLDTGEAAEEAIEADITVCMAAVKVGLLRFPAYRLAGALEAVDIGLPEGLPAFEALKIETVTEEMVRKCMPDRPEDGHKGTFGTVAVAAGSVNFTGAAYLCSAAAYRIGAGLVQVSVPAPLHAALAGQLPEVTWVLLPHEMGVIAEGAVDTLVKHLEKASVLVWGPGFGLEETTAAFVRRLIEGKGQAMRGRGIGFVAPERSASEQSAALPPMVIDADGLKLLARIQDWHKLLPPMSILTPHPGEMAILTGKTVGEIQSNRIGAAVDYAKAWGHVVVLKGAMTVIASPDGRVRVVPVATSALAHGGTGDVLAGMIAGLCAQGVQPFDACTAGAWIHAQTGLLAAEELGHPASVLAGNLIDVLPEVLSWIW